MSTEIEIKQQMEDLKEELSLVKKRHTKEVAEIQHKINMLRLDCPHQMTILYSGMDSYEHNICKICGLEK